MAKGRWKPKTEAETRTLDMIQRRWNAADQALNRCVNGHTLRAIKERSAHRVLGDHWDTPAPTGLKQVTINRIGTAVTTTESVQTEQPLKLNLTAHQTDDPPIFFLTARGINKLKELAKPKPVTDETGAPTLDEQDQPTMAPTAAFEGFADQDLTTETPLDSSEGEVLAGLAEPQVDPMTGAITPAVLEDGRDIIRLNDAAAAEKMEIMVSAKLEEANWDYYAGELVFLNNTFGDQVLWYQYDVDTARVSLKCPNYLNVRYDPDSSWILDAREIFLDQRISVARAIALYPQFAREIASEGRSSGSAENVVFSNDGAKEGGKVDRSTGSNRTDVTITAERGEEKLTIRTMWQRDHLVPLDEQAAVERGDIYPELDEGEDEVGEKFSVATGRMLAMIEGHAQEVRPESAEWPKRKAIRQIQVLVEAGRVIEDIECPFADIPLPYMKNLTVMYSPYGMGEPFRLEDLQEEINRVASYITNNIRFFQNRQRMLPKSVLDAMGGGTELSTNPMANWPIPDDLWHEFFQNQDPSKYVLEPAGIDGSWIAYLQVLLEQFKTLAGDVDAVSGQEPSPGSSGVAINELQVAGSRLMAHKAKSLKWVFEWIVRLTVQSLIDFAPDEEYDKYLAEYGPAVRVVLRTKMKTRKYNIRVDTAAGRATNDALESQKAQEEFVAGAIPTEDYLARRRHPDPKGAVLKRKEEDRREAAMLQFTSPEQGVPEQAGQPT